jgi:thiol-disulfide isomerase/thioredoxin
MQTMDGQGEGRTTRRQFVAGSVASFALTWASAARAAHVVRPWPAGKPTPALALTDLDGKAWTLSALKGRPVVMKIWAIWCEPCRAEMPSLELLQTRHDKTGLVILSVNYQEPQPKIKRFLETLPISLPILLDREGEAAAAWTPRVFPTTVLIDRSGAARSSVIGELDWMGDAARGLIEPLLAAAPRAA